jgi:putative ABC transport system substrate-binding protein
MRRIALLGVTLLLPMVVVITQAVARPARLGVLTIGAPNRTPTNPAPSRLFPPFFQELRARGHVEGGNLVVEWRFADWKAERLPALAEELVQAGVDVILVVGPHGLQAARKATPAIPIVMVASTDDPVRDGLVASLARPGGNITGLTYAVSPEVVGKQLQVLAEIIPGLRRVRVLDDYPGAGTQPLRAAFEGAAKQLRLEAQPAIPVLDLERLPAAFADIHADRTDAVLVLMAGLTFARRDQVATLAARSRVPIFGYFRELSEAGGLLSYGPDIVDLYRRAGIYVDRILRGARPADLPVEQPTKFELVINIKTAKALGLTIPQSVLLRADEVLQ